MTLRPTHFLCLSSFCLAAVLGAASPARADDEPWLLAIGLDFVAPLTEPQSSLFLPGGELSVALRHPFDPVFAASLRGFGGLLFDGAPPADGNRVDPGLGSWVGVGLGLRIRPVLGAAGPDRATGLCLELEVGGVWTGPLVRPELSATLGYGVDLGALVIEPRVRVMHVVHFDDPVDSGQGVLLMGGFALVFGERHAVALVEEPEPAVDLDRDDDGILDEVDGCPDVPEDLDGIDDLDGCPETDVDGDGILDEVDACLRDPEDLDGLADLDGCPEEDLDGDGVLDPGDACPEVPEVVNGVADDDGCPDEGLIVLENDRVVLDARVLFDTNQARVRHAARPILQAVVDLVLDHPEWTHVRIEGYADERGTEEFNERLSERRARRVREVLEELGAPTDRLEMAWFGEHHPRAPSGHAADRRVEFVMITGSVPDAPTGGAL